MAKSIATEAELKYKLKQACSNAIKSSCHILLDELGGIIEKEYYDQYDPLRYKRTYQFWKSASTEVFSNLCGVIFMDESAMNYGNYWNGQKQLLFASEGYHGGYKIQAEGKFWETFVSYCENNAMRILKEELIKQGLSIK